MRLATLLVVLCAAQVYGLKQTFDFKNRKLINPLAPRFGLDVGATVQLDINVQLRPQNKQAQPAREGPFYAYIALYTLEQSVDGRLEDDPKSPSKVCSLPSARRYQIECVTSNPDQAPTGSLSVQFQIQELDQYLLLLLNCGDEENKSDETSLQVTAKGEVVLLNPNGQHLSLDEVPLGPMFVVFLVVYSALVFVWLFGNLKHRGSSMMIQRLLGLALILKHLEVVLSVAYFDEMSNKGTSPTMLIQSRDVFELIANAVFLAVLLLMALGWTVTRDFLTLREKQLFWGAFIMYGMFGVLHALCTDPNLCGAYLLSFYVIKFLITFCIIVAMNANIERLRSGALDQPGHANTTSQLYAKLKMFQTFRWAFLAYLVLPIMLMFVQVTVLTWKQMWVAALLNELLYLCVYLLVGYTFRPRQFPQGTDRSYVGAAQLEMHAGVEADAVLPLAGRGEREARPSDEIEMAPLPQHDVTDGVGSAGVQPTHRRVSAPMEGAE